MGFRERNKDGSSRRDSLWGWCVPNKHRKSRETRWPRGAGAGEPQEPGSEVLGGQRDRRLAPGGRRKSLAFVPSEAEELGARTDVATPLWFTPVALCTQARREKGQGG